MYIYSPGQRPNGVLDPEQLILSATSYQYTVIFFSIRSILSGAKNGQHRNYLVSINVVRSPRQAPKGIPRTPQGGRTSDWGGQGDSRDESNPSKGASGAPRTSPCTAKPPPGIPKEISQGSS